MNNVMVIAGPTASGKSKLALDIARAQPSVIINADSQQVYMELPVLTARPSVEEMNEVPHVLYGAISGHEPCTAARWCEMAATEVRRAWGAGKQVLVVGGTGLYISGLIEGLSPIPDIDKSVRAKGNALWEELGAEKFYAMLQKRDAVMAEKLKPTDKQRVVRAYEVLEGTGKSLSHFQDMPRVKPLPEAAFEVKVISVPREELYQRCDERFLKMLQHGGIDEVKAVQHFPKNSPLHKIIGVPELSAYIKGKMTLEEATLKAQQMTRNYAKRQMTWFRNQF